MPIKIKLGKRIGNLTTILVNVTNDRSRPVDQQPVELLITGIKFTHGDTNDEGDVSFDNVPVDPAADILTITARTLMGGQWITKDLQVVNKKGEKLIPDRLSANSAGDAGKYVIIVGVMSKDNAPVSDVPVRIINELTGADADTGQTDQHGSFITAPGKINFTEQECSFLVIAGGLDPVELKLEGPSKWKKYSKPDIPQADFQQGLLHAIKVGWKTKPAGF